MFHDEKWSPLVTKLTWSHFITVMPLKDDNEIMFYLENVIKKSQIKRELQESIKLKEYFRLPLESRKKVIDNTKHELKDNQSSTLGIIIVRSLNKIYVEYSSNENIIPRKYFLFNSI